MLTIRLSRVGRKNQPLYRVIVSEKGRDPWGKALEILGNFNGRSSERKLEVDTERVKYWLSKGAQMSDTIFNLFVDHKIVEGKKHNVTHISKTRAAKIAEEAAKNAPKEEPKAEEKPADQPAA